VAPRDCDCCAPYARITVVRWLTVYLNQGLKYLPEVPVAAETKLQQKRNTLSRLPCIKYYAFDSLAIRKSKVQIYSR